MVSQNMANPKDFIGQNLYRLGNLFKSQNSDIGAEPDNREDDFTSKKQRELVNNILSGKSKEEAIERRVPGQERWFKTRFLPLVRRTIHGGVEGEAFIDGVVGASLDITGKSSATSSHPRVSFNMSRKNFEIKKRRTPDCLQMHSRQRKRVG